MRILRHKHARKALHFYRLTHGIAPPYRVLLDGNFVAAAVKMQQEVEGRVLGLLGGRAFLHVTECAVRELAALGPALAPAVAAARRIAVIRCSHKYGHGAATDAATCLRSLVGPSNDGKWVVATQDADLRDALRKVPGTPLVLFSKNVLVLEPPSADSRAASASAEADKAGLTADERRAVKAAVAALRDGSAAPTAGAGAGGAAAAVGAVGAAAAAASATPTATAAAATAGVKRKRHGPSEPNPLSMKRKAAPAPGAAAPKPAAAVAAAGGAGAASDAAAGKHTRRGGRKAKRARGSDGGGGGGGGGSDGGGDSD